VFCIALIAASEEASLIGSAGTIVVALLFYAFLQLRRVRQLRLQGA